MSLYIAPSDDRTGRVTTTRNGKRVEISRNIRRALDLMAWKGARFDNAAREVGFPVATMRSALERPHVQAYLRAQRDVFRTSLVDRATHRMVELSEQTGNANAAVTATAKLMNEADEQVSAAAQRHAPGLVVVIQAAGASPALPHQVTIDASSNDIRGLPDKDT